MKESSGVKKMVWFLLFYNGECQSLSNMVLEYASGEQRQILEARKTGELGLYLLFHT